MAVELTQYIQMQLDILPKNHPDRYFLVQQLKVSEAYLEKAPNVALNKQRGGRLNYGEHIADYFSLIKFGPFFNFEQLAEHLHRTQLSSRFLTYGESLLSDICQNGNDSLAHLVVPTRAWRLITNRGIETISGLKDTIINQPQYLPPRNRLVAQNSLRRFDFLLNQSQNMQS